MTLDELLASLSARGWRLCALWQAPNMSWSCQLWTGEDYTHTHGHLSARAALAEGIEILSEKTRYSDQDIRALFKSKMPKAQGFLRRA